MGAESVTTPGARGARTTLSVLVTATAVVPLTLMGMSVVPAVGARRPGATSGAGACARPVHTAQTRACAHRQQAARRARLRVLRNERAARRISRRHPHLPTP